MYRVFTKYFLLFLIFLISSCSSDSIIGPETSIDASFSYPDSTGNYWFYNYKNIVTNYSHDSIKHYFDEDTLRGTGISRFNGDTLMNGIHYKIYSSQHVGGVHGQGSHNTTEYYLNSDTGFVLYASRSTGVSFGPYKVNPVVSYRYSNKTFHSIPDLFNNFREVPSAVRADSVNFLNSPVNCIRYPAIQSPSWYTYSVSDIYRVYREYAGMENVTVNSNLLSCVKISKKFYRYSDGGLDTNLLYTDYLSTGGLVKRSYFIRNIGLYNKMGELIGYFDANEEVQVVNYLAN